MRAIAGLIVGVVYLQVVLGGLVAGTRAGLSYNTWPLMDGALVPSGLATLSPWWLNAFENITTIQFNHRLIAYLIVGLAALHAIGVWRAPRETNRSGTRLIALALLATVAAQAGLGIATLMSVRDARIPIGLGVAHQVGASLLLVLAIFAVTRHAGWSGGKRGLPARSRL